MPCWMLFYPLPESKDDPVPFCTHSHTEPEAGEWPNDGIIVQVQSCIINQATLITTYYNGVVTQVPR